MSYKIIIVSVFTLLFSTTVPAQCTVPNSANELHEKKLLIYLKTLSSDPFMGRKFNSQESNLTQNYIVSNLKKLSVPAFKNTYRHIFSDVGFFSTKQGANIIGFIEGKTKTDQYIVLSAHFDHLGNKGHKIFNGADDNASGTSALLAYAGMLVKDPLEHSVIILFTDGEEVNLLGAKAFISEQEEILDQIKLNINIDMIGGDNKTKVLNYITHDFDKLLTEKKHKSLNTCLKDQSIKIKKGFNKDRSRNRLAGKTNWRMASDHAVFYKKNIPFIYFGVGTNKNYHTNKDTYKNINTEFFTSATAAIYQQLRFLDKNITFSDL